MLSIFWGVNNNREILAEAMHNPKESACEFLEYWYDGISKQTLSGGKGKELLKDIDYQ